MRIASILLQYAHSFHFTRKTALSDNSSQHLRGGTGRHDPDHGPRQEGTNTFRPSRGFHFLAWCPGNTLPAPCSRVCVCAYVRMCVCTSIYVCVCMPALYCVCRTTEQSLAHHPCLRLRPGPITYLNTKSLAAKAAGRARALAACKVGCHSRLLSARVARPADPVLSLWS